MELLLALTPLLIVAGIIGAILYFTRRYEQQRTARLEHLADELSLGFSAAGDVALEVALADLPLMQRGRSRKMTNLIFGRSGSVNLGLFDFQYTTGSGKNKTTHKLSIAAFDSPLLQLPPFELSPENILHRVAGVFGYQDIDFAGYPTFNKNFLLRGPDETAIRQTFTEPVVQHFERYLEQRHPTVEIIGQRNRLLVATRRQKPEHLRNYLEHAFGIFGVLKSPESEPDDPILTKSADHG
jgi:hypothetical protein